MQKPETPNSTEKTQELQKVITGNQENEEKSNGRQERIARLKNFEYDNFNAIMKAFEPFENSAQYSVIQNPREILDPNTKIDKIIIAPVTVTAQKVIYNIFPIKLAPLKGQIRHMNRVTNYISANPDLWNRNERVLMEQEILIETLIDFSKSSQKISEGMLRNSKEFQPIPKAVNDNLVINKHAGSNAKGFSYLYNGIPAAVSITPIVVATGSLDIEKSEKMVAKRIENLRLYICAPDKLEWTIEYVLTKKTKTMEAPTASIIMKDRQGAYRSINTIRTSLIITSLALELVGLIFVALNKMRDYRFLIAAIILITSVCVLDNIITKILAKKMPVVMKERDLFKENNEKYLRIHREWLLKNESPEFQNQLIGDFNKVAQEVEFAQTQVAGRKQSKKKKNRKTTDSGSGNDANLRIIELLNKQTDQTKTGAQSEANVVKVNNNQTNGLDSEIKIVSINQEKHTEKSEPMIDTNAAAEYNQADEANDSNGESSGKKLVLSDLDGLDEELVDSINKFLKM